MENNTDAAAYGQEIKKIEFVIGRFGSTLPMLIFIVWAIILSIMDWITEGALILGMVSGLIITLFLAKRPWSKYAEAIFNGMTVPVGVIAVICWFFAGMFAEVLKVGGLVDGLVWLGQTLGLSGGFFVVITFLLACAFASAVGTGYGTVITFVALLYPTGLAMGCDPIILLAAILSGAAFGDNLAPVSDTTIVSAVTQETDIPGVVKSRFKYAIIAAIPALFLFYLLGDASSTIISDAMKEAKGDEISALGLILLIPFGIVITLALKRFHIIICLTWGIVSAIILILIMHLINGLSFFDTINSAFCFGLTENSNIDISKTIIFVGQVENKAVIDGALFNGLKGYFEMAILVLLIVTAGHIMKIGGGLDAILEFLKKLIKESVRRAEIAIWSMVSIVNVFITINTAAEIAVSPFVRELGKKAKLHPYRRANFLDAISSALGYIFPWSGAVILAVTQIDRIITEYPFLENIFEKLDVNFGMTFPFVFHGWFLLLVMLIAAITGFGRKMKEK